LTVLSDLPVLTGSDIEQLLQWLPATLQTADGILSPGAVQVRMTWSVNIEPRLCRESVIPFCQVIQRMANELLTVTRIWKRGRPEDAGELHNAVVAFIAVLQKLADYVGFSPLIPKVHELLHAGSDLRMFGPASFGTSAGCSSDDLTVVAF